MVTGDYTPECPARHLFRIRSNGEDLVVFAGSLPWPKSQDMPDLESIHGHLPRQLHSVVQISFALLPRLPRQSSRLHVYGAFENGHASATATSTPKALTASTHRGGMA